MADADAEVLKGKRPRRPLKAALPNTPDPIEIAMVAAASGKPLPDVARRILEEQARLIRAQIADLRLRHVGEGVRALLWAVLAIAAAALLALMIAVVLRAARTDALLVQSFRVPPALEAEGLSGEVVATQVLDKLAEMQERTESVRGASTYANNWEDQLKIEIPNTGASADQVWKLLRGWLGKETRISGEVIRTKDGLALTARVGSAPGKRFVSAAGDLDRLITQGAELIYEKTQPYRYAIYLSNDPMRASEGTPVLQRLASDDFKSEHKWAFSGLSVQLRRAGDFHGAVAMAEKALAIDRQMLSATANLGSASLALGHDQMTADTYERQFELPLTAEYDSRIIAANRCAQIATLGWIMRDQRRAAEAVSCLQNSSGTLASGVGRARANLHLLKHEPGTAATFVEKASVSLPAQAALAVTAEVRLRAEMLRGSSPGLVRALQEFDLAAEAASADAETGFYRALAPRLAWPLRAEALAILGNYSDAATLIAKTPLNCYTCVRVRGIVAGGMGDRTGAQKWFAEAVRQAPRLAPAYVDWGRLLLNAGRIGSAHDKLNQAARLAPHWADPLKHLGDAFAAGGKKPEALQRYDAALKLAPNWTELRTARARVAHGR